MKIKLTYINKMGTPYPVQYNDVLSYEIIEEDKKIEKIESWNQNTGTTGWMDKIDEKINELVDAINKLKAVDK